MTGNAPTVSVVMSMRNEQPHVARAIQSILAQTLEDLELIIIDDYSTDASMDVCRAFADRRIRLHVKTSEAPHLAASRNLGIQMARGRWVTFQDADDTCQADRLARQLELATAGAGPRVAGCSIRRVQDGRERICAMPAAHEQIVKGFGRSYRRTTIVAGTILAPRAVLERFPYRTQFRYMQDWDQLLRMHESGEVRFGNCPEPLYTYFIRSKGAMAQPQWLDFNIFVRHCQHRRRQGRPECGNLEEFRRHLAGHPLECARWMALRAAIGRRKAMLQALSGTAHQFHTAKRRLLQLVLAASGQPRRAENPSPWYL